MPDIGMCKNKDCEQRTSCYRFMAKPCEYQWYQLYNPNSSGICEGKIELVKSKRVRKPKIKKEE